MEVPGAFEQQLWVHLQISAVLGKGSDAKLCLAGICAEHSQDAEASLLWNRMAMGPASGMTTG